MIDMPKPAPVGYRKEFNAKAGALTLRLSTGSPVDYAAELQPKRFDSGALGWGGKLPCAYVKVGSLWFICDVTVTVRVRSSKKWGESDG